MINKHPLKLIADARTDVVSQVSERFTRLLFERFWILPPFGLALFISAREKRLVFVALFEKQLVEFCIVDVDFHYVGKQIVAASELGGCCIGWGTWKRIILMWWIYEAVFWIVLVVKLCLSLIHI